jgi:hypothetical protein
MESLFGLKRWLNSRMKIKNDKKVISKMRIICTGLSNSLSVININAMSSGNVEIVFFIFRIKFDAIEVKNRISAGPNNIGSRSTAVAKSPGDAPPLSPCSMKVSS